MNLKAFCCSGEILVADYVVTVENSARFVTAEFHRNPLGDAGAYHIAPGGPPQIVNDDSGKFRLFAGCFPSFAKIADRFACLVKDEQTLRSPYFFSALY